MGRSSRKKTARARHKSSRSDGIKPRPSIPIERPDHNSRVGYIVVPQFASGDVRHGKATPRGNPGTYRVTFVLSVPGSKVFREQLNLGRTYLEGDSLLMVSAEVVTVRVATGSPDLGSMILTKNQQGRIATIVVRVQADSFEDAERRAYDMATAFLSYVSYVNDTAIDLTGYELLEESVGTVKGVFGMIGRQKAFTLPSDSGTWVSDDKYKRILAAYREGMNATNVFYQALSFWKVIEGCKRLRDAKNAVAKAGATQPYTPLLEMPARIEEVPLSDELVREMFRPFLGRKLSAVVDHFRPLLRNAIAHLDPSQDVLDIDRYDDVVTCMRAIPVLRYMARQYIGVELANP